MEKRLTTIKMRAVTWIALLATALFLSACAADPQKQPEAAALGMTECENPRPEICTMDYTPVCGQLISGEEKTYANGCSACSVTNVIGYKAGECQ